jgi:DNA-3-methyladenine glycosylase I
MSTLDDGRTRCSWATFVTAATGAPSTQADHVMYRDYHDTEWGQPVRDSAALFERVSLEAFQSGLSWLIILRKRESFRAAFDHFDVERVAHYTDRDVERLMSDAGIVRNRAKIEATIANARVVADLADAGVDLTELMWSFAPAPRPRPVDMSQVPAVSPESTAMAKELKRRGFRFVGPTTAYALMQATGMVDDHLASCWVPQRLVTTAGDAARQVIEGSLHTHRPG